MNSDDPRYAIPLADGDAIVRPALPAQAETGRTTILEDVFAEPPPSITRQTPSGRNPVVASAAPEANDGVLPPERQPTAAWRQVVPRPAQSPASAVRAAAEETALARTKLSVCGEAPHWPARRGVPVAYVPDEGEDRDVPAAGRPGPQPRHRESDSDYQGWVDDTCGAAGQAEEGEFYHQRDKLDTS
jgi:hypothetical protein